MRKGHRATDLLARWWDSADRAALDATRLLPLLVPGRLYGGLAGRGLEAAALLLERAGFLVAVVLLHTGPRRREGMSGEGRRGLRSGWARRVPSRA